jgi:hypothetical protein
MLAFRLAAIIGLIFSASAGLSGGDGPLAAF